MSGEYEADEGQAGKAPNGASGPSGECGPHRLRAYHTVVEQILQTGAQEHSIPSVLQARVELVKGLVITFRDRAFRYQHLWLDKPW